MSSTFVCTRGCKNWEPCYHCQECGGWGDECSCGPVDEPDVLLPPAPPIPANNDW